MLAERSRTTIPFESDGTRRRSFAVGVADDTATATTAATSSSASTAPAIAVRRAWRVRAAASARGIRSLTGPPPPGRRGSRSCPARVPARTRRARTAERARSASPARASARASRSRARRRSSGGRPTASRTRASARSSGSATWRRARRRSSGARSTRASQHEDRGHDVQGPPDRRRGVGPVRRRNGCLAAEGGRRVRDLGLRDPRLDGRRRPAHGPRGGAGPYGHRRQRHQTPPGPGRADRRQALQPVA